MCKFNLIASFLWIYHFVLSFTKNAVWFSDTTTYLLMRLIIGQFVLLKDTLKQACSIYKVCICIDIWLLCNVKFIYTGTKIKKKMIEIQLTLWDYNFRLICGHLPESAVCKLLG